MSTTTRTDLLSDETVLLSNVSWSTYEKLLADLANQSTPHLTYSQGVLQIMSPGPAHERLAHILERIIERFAEENDINVYCLRSTTFKRKAFKRGFEPDSCFYVRNEASVRDKEKIDLRNDPPPDLVIEVDISSGSIDKFPILAQMCVPEVWRHDGNELAIYILREKSYVQSINSLAFPAITCAGASEFIQQSKKLPSTEFVKALRRWLNELKTPR